MPHIDQIEEYMIDVLGYTQDECNKFTTDELWEFLPLDKQAECLAFSA